MIPLRNRLVGGGHVGSATFPDFVVAGVPRAGTTTLAAHLRSLPDVFLPVRKELHFFTLNRHRGLGWYAQHYRDARSDQVCGDVTPAYLLHGEAVADLASTLPDALVVIVLRDPVARAYSHFRLNQWKGIESLGFEEALAAEHDRLARAPSDMPFGYVASGEYVRLLRRLHAHVPPERVLVVLFDDLAADPTAVVGEFCQRMGTAPSGPLLPQRSNHHGPVRSTRASVLARHLPGPACRTVRRWNTRSGEYPVMDARTQARLAAHFEDCNAGLADIIGRPVPWGGNR